MSENMVSIIVPIYNSEDYLPRCIESIINQSYHNIEILLVDDGSADDSLKICNDYASVDSRIKVIHQDNQGVSAARNTGLKNMIGKYFSFVDSDDSLRDHAIELLLNDLLEYRADISLAMKSTVLSDGTIRTANEDHSVSVYSGLDMLKRSLDGEAQTFSACAKLYKTSRFQTVRFAEGRSVNEDGFFLFQCYLLQPTVVQHNESIYLYYVREGSNSRDLFSDKHLDMLYFCEQKKEMIQKQYPQLAHKLANMEVRTLLFFLGVLCRTNDKKYAATQKECIRKVKQNYSAFLPRNGHERQLAWIVAHGFYPFYKAAVRMKYYR